MYPRLFEQRTSSQAPAWFPSTMATQSSTLCLFGSRCPGYQLVYVTAAPGAYGFSQIHKYAWIFMISVDRPYLVFLLYLTKIPMLKPERVIFCSITLLYYLLSKETIN